MYVFFKERYAHFCLFMFCSLKRIAPSSNNNQPRSYYVSKVILSIPTSLSRLTLCHTTYDQFEVCTHQTCSSEGYNMTEGDVCTSASSTCACSTDGMYGTTGTTNQASTGVSGFCCGFVMGIVLLSSNIRKRNDKILWLGSGTILAFLMTVISFSLIGTAVVPEDLGNACKFYDEVHVENHDCTCGSQLYSKLHSCAEHQIRPCVE